MSFLHQILSINKESMTGIAIMMFYDYLKFDTFFLTHTLFGIHDAVFEFITLQSMQLELKAN